MRVSLIAVAVVGRIELQSFVTQVEILESQVRLVRVLARESMLRSPPAAAQLPVRLAQTVLEATPQIPVFEGFRLMGRVQGVRVGRRA